MVIGKVFSAVMLFVPIRNSKYNFGKAYISLYNLTPPTKLIVTGVKNAAIDYITTN